MEKKEPKTSTVRLTPESLKWAKIASGYTGESVAEYISRTIVETAQRDAERLHAEALRGATADPESPARGRKGK
ncbi:MAG: hypothetical protein BGO49_04505 [Planctomycetales bacterium 71-10]|nr:MAG: hypothetical protein BGO49_04505 [Planctomycetales bacterium 71-10]